MKQERAAETPPLFHMVKRKPKKKNLALKYSLTWLPQVLRSAGLTVVEQPGWQTRGHGDVGAIKFVICHHTAGSLTGNAPSLGIVTNGRPDLQGPLSQLVLGRDGTFYVIAAGKAWHAGEGVWQGVKDGNTYAIGIEAENTGLVSGPKADPWPWVQMNAYQRGVAAILTRIKAGARMCAGHKEYATPKGRKIDPTFDMIEFRKWVMHFMLHPKFAREKKARKAKCTRSSPRCF